MIIIKRQTYRYYFLYRRCKYSHRVLQRTFGIPEYGMVDPRSMGFCRRMATSKSSLGHKCSYLGHWRPQHRMYRCLWTVFFALCHHWAKVSMNPIDSRSTRRCNYIWRFWKTSKCVWPILILAKSQNSSCSWLPSYDSSEFPTTRLEQGRSESALNNWKHHRWFFPSKDDHQYRDSSRWPRNGFVEVAHTPGK